MSLTALIPQGPALRLAWEEGSMEGREARRRQKETGRGEEEGREVEPQN